MKHCKIINKSYKYLHVAFFNKSINTKIVAKFVSTKTKYLLLERKKIMTSSMNNITKL
jgi:hypothetical protein